MEVRWGEGQGSSEEETAWQEEKWESEERLHKWGLLVQSGPNQRHSHTLTV